MDRGNELPQRVVKVDFGKARPPTVMYTASPDVIVKFLRALRNWNPDYTVEVEPLKYEARPPSQPMWCLRAWED